MKFKYWISIIFFFFENSREEETNLSGGECDEIREKSRRTIKDSARKSSPVQQEEKRIAKIRNRKTCEQQVTMTSLRTMNICDRVVL